VVQTDGLFDVHIYGKTKTEFQRAVFFKFDCVYTLWRPLGASHWVHGNSGGGDPRPMFNPLRGPPPGGRGGPHEGEGVALLKWGREGMGGSPQGGGV
jgi:hypothetical protein